MEEVRDKNGLTEKEFLERYDVTIYDRPSVTVDIILIEDGKVLLIRRGGHPGYGKLAFPGGFIEPNENVYHAAERELAEETHLKAKNLRQMNVASEPGRDPRTRIITVPFLAEAEDYSALKADDDALSAKWFPFSVRESVINGTVIYEVTVLDGDERKKFKVTRSCDKSGLSADPIYKQIGESPLAGDHGEIFVRALDELKKPKQIL